MTDPRFDEAAAIIAAARLTPASMVRLPPELTPADQAEAYAIQRQLRRRLGEAGKGEQVGWKVGSTTAAMQKLLSVPAPAAGAILASNVLRSPARLTHGSFRRVGVECEMAVVLAADLVPKGKPVDRNQAEAAVGALHPAIEIVDDR